MLSIRFFDITLGMTNTRNIVYILIVIILFAVAALFYFKGEDESAVKGVNTFIQEETGLEYEIKIEPVDNQKSPEYVGPTIDLDRSTDFQSATEKDKKAIGEVVTRLKSDPNNISDLLALATLRKVIGDYDGARLAFEQVIKVSPENSLAYRNLGDLYAYHLKDNVKAEQNLLLAIEKNPNQIEYYFKITDLYINFINSPNKARAIVQKGIKANPTSTELLSLEQSI